jgi:5-methylcytosine-specific restriction endonuclease McrA
VFVESEFSVEEQEILALFGNRCARCGHTPITLHEIIPKSLNPKALDPTNRIPLCYDCHMWAHKKGYRFSQPELTKLRLKGIDTVSTHAN